jgi:hypothetical protein
LIATNKRTVIHVRQQLFLDENAIYVIVVTHRPTQDMSGDISDDGQVVSSRLAFTFVIVHSVDVPGTEVVRTHANLAKHNVGTHKGAPFRAEDSRAAVAMTATVY